MVALTDLVQRFQQCRILVVGDLMLDRYTVGKVSRISPEAPVPVLRVHHEEARPGGAGNVALNLVSLGAEVVLAGQVGDDEAGSELIQVLEEQGMSVAGVIRNSEYQTPVKNRLIADTQQVVRVDHEKLTLLSSEREREVIERIPSILEGVDVVAISDYAKGFLTRYVLEQFIQQAGTRGIPVIVDPKEIDFTRYRGATAVKPNWSEAIAAAGLGSDASVDEIGNKLLEETEAEMILMTRSQDGISLFQSQQPREDFPVRVREVKDVTGAGDTVLAMVTVAFAHGATPAEASQLANVAAGIAIEHLGCARVSLSQVARRLLMHDGDHKVFYRHHLFALPEVLRERPCMVLQLDSREGLTPPAIAMIDRLSKESDSALVLCLTDDEPDRATVRVLAALKQVDFLVVASEAELRERCPALNVAGLFHISEHQPASV